MKKYKNNYSFLLAMAFKEKGKLLIAILGAVISTLLSYVPYFVVFQVITKLISRTAVASELITLAVIGVGAVILQAALKAISGITSHVAAYNILHLIRLKVVEQISKFNMGFFAEHSSGEMKKMIDEDIAKIESFIAHNTLDFVAGVTAPIAVVIIMFSVSWQMTLALLIPTLLFMTLTLATMGNHEHLSSESNKKSGEFNSVINEYVSGMPVIKTYNVTTNSFQKYKDTISQYVAAKKATAKSSCKPLALLLILTDCGLLFTLPFGGWLFLNGGITASSYILFMILSLNFLYAVSGLFTIKVNLSEIISGVSKVREILEMEPLPDGTVVLPHNARCDIEFQDVSFAYGEKDVLSNVNIMLPKNTLTAFVGTSGAGKSTAAQLLLKFWLIDRGGIYIDGININNIKTESLMDKTAFVFQKVFLLDDTLMENIRMGNTLATDEEVIKAAKAAQIHDVIMNLPNAYSTRLGESGIKLSGGEKQRVSIARAILKNTPIIIFDEATSFSDIENEHKIQTALGNLLKDKTTIMIAHRLNTIMNADNIGVFDNGRISEQGTHKELIDKQGLYSNMWSIYTTAAN